jgi:hypothetical protein
MDRLDSREIIVFTLSLGIERTWLEPLDWNIYAIQCKSKPTLNIYVHCSG